MRDAMAVFVGGAIEGFGGRDFIAGFEVEDLLASQGGVKSIGAMHSNVRFRRVPIACGIGLELQPGRRRKQFEAVMRVIKLWWCGGENELELFVRGDDEIGRAHV